MFSVILYMLRQTVGNHATLLPFSPITVTFPKLSVILRPLYIVTGVSEGRYVYPEDGGYSSSFPEILVALT
jgi:hypothetical protein